LQITPLERNIFKSVVLGLMYGLGNKNLSEKLGLSENGEPSEPLSSRWCSFKTQSQVVAQ